MFPLTYSLSVINILCVLSTTAVGILWFICLVVVMSEAPNCIIKKHVMGCWSMVCCCHSKKRWFVSCRTSITCSTCNSATASSFSISSNKCQSQQLTRSADHRPTPSINIRRHHQQHTAMLASTHGQRQTCLNRRTREVFQMACRNATLPMLPFHPSLLMKMTQMLVSSTSCR